VKLPWNHSDLAETASEPVTERLPAVALARPRGSGKVASAAPGAHERRGKSSRSSLSQFEGLESPPAIGRIAGTWQQHLAASGWRRPSLAADCGVMGGWFVAAASALGRTHAHRAQERQDAYGLTLSGQTLVCAVADGVSGAEFGGPAADVAVHYALEAIDGQARERGLAVTDLGLLDVAAGQARNAVGKLSRSLGVGAGQCATTLLLTAVSVADRESRRMDVSVVSVGDSSVIELRADATVEVLVGPLGGASSRELGDYLPRGESAIIRRRVGVRRGSVLLLATDGLAQDLCQSPAVREWVAAQLRRATTPVAAAHVLSYQRQRSSDDLTFVALRRQQWP
jgi:serine/threonine protein phosphatase PrpC